LRDDKRAADGRVLAGGLGGCLIRVARHIKLL